MGGNLALVQSFVLLASVLYPQRPVAEVARVLHQEPVVAAVRGQADRQQLVVFPPEPRYLYILDGGTKQKENTQPGRGRMRDFCFNFGRGGNGKAK